MQNEAHVRAQEASTKWSTQYLLANLCLSIGSFSIARGVRKSEARLRAQEAYAQ